MAQHNARVIKLVTDRYSAHVRRFNHLDVSDADSDAQYDLYKELEKLARAAFGRAPEFKPSGNRMALAPWADLGDAYRELRRNLTPDERTQYMEIQERLCELNDKYEG